MYVTEQNDHGQAHVSGMVRHTGRTGSRFRGNGGVVFHSPTDIADGLAADILRYTNRELGFAIRDSSTLPNDLPNINSSRPWTWVGQQVVTFTFSIPTPEDSTTSSCCTAANFSLGFNEKYFVTRAFEWKASSDGDWVASDSVKKAQTALTGLESFASYRACCLQKKKTLLETTFRQNKLVGWLFTAVSFLIYTSYIWNRLTLDEVLD